MERERASEMENKLQEARRILSWAQIVGPGALNYIRTLKGESRQRSCPHLHYALRLAFVLMKRAVLAPFPSALSLNVATKGLK